ncbi:MAG TPA: PDZ domain-containing protein, partial [Candidatus Binataceae bacterium]|nr:PDZ domain-containing protein [Candidatus Binataceae bacterium]
PGPGKAIRTAHGLGLSVQEMTPDLAQYFRVEPLGGVLVAEVGPDATKAGIEHGDIITQIEGREVHTPEEFARQAIAAGANRNVAVTLLRGGKTQVVTVPSSSNAARPVTGGESAGSR